MVSNLVRMLEEKKVEKRVEREICETYSRHRRIHFAGSLENLPIPPHTLIAFRRLVCSTFSYLFRQAEYAGASDCDPFVLDHGKRSLGTVLCSSGQRLAGKERQKSR